MAAVMKAYGPLKEATSGELLFNGRCWDTVKNLPEHIRNGHYSDPPDVTRSERIVSLLLWNKRHQKWCRQILSGTYFELFNMTLVYVRHIRVGTLNRTTFC